MRRIGRGDRTGAPVRRDPGIRITIAVGQHLRTVNVGDGSNLGHAFLRAVDSRVDGKKMLCRKVI